MRLRNVTGAISTVNNHALVNQEPKKYKGSWNEFFGNDYPIYIEIGMGKGDFIIQNAIKYPQINFIGIEKYSAVILRAVQKVESFDPPITNLCLLRFDATELLDVFDEDEIGRVYLNFSDPWPKDRTAKRRLTHHRFLERYKHVLPDSGLVRFKTDNADLFAFSLEEVQQSSFVLTKETSDLHHSEFVENNIMTEYEAKFVQEGKPIHLMELKNVKKPK